MDKFTSKHLAFLILGTTIVSLKTYPSIYMRDSGRDSWIAVIVSSLLILFYFLYFLSVCIKTKNFNLTSIYKKAFGSKLGTVFILLFILTLVLTLSESSSVEANSMHTNMLLLTPPWVLVLFFIYPALYTKKKGLAAVVTVTLIGITLIVLAGINLAILTAKYKKFKYLFPVMENGITTGFIVSILKSLGLYGCLAIVLPFLNEIQDTAKLKGDGFLGTLMLIQMIIVAVTGVIMTFGIIRSNVISYPKLIQTQRISYFGFLENGELYVMLQIVGGWFIKYILTFQSISLLFDQLNFRSKYIDYFISVVVSISAFYFSYNIFRLFYLLNYYVYICLLNFIIIPLLAITIFKFKNKAPAANKKT